MKDQYGNTAGTWQPGTYRGQRVVTLKEKPTRAICITGFMNDPVGSESEADARLIAQAKNMRDALIETIEELAEQYGEVGYSTVDDAKGVIEAATGLTWEQIKV